MVFFQAVLLLGYLYAHALSTRVARRWQWRGARRRARSSPASCCRCRLAIGEPGGADPRWWALRALAPTVGLPFFALSATAPLLQHWFSRHERSQGAGSRISCYATSNAGSLLGLLAYPLVEPFASRSTQATGWSVGFWAVAALVAACAYASRPPLAGASAASGCARVDGASATGRSIGSRLSQRALWIVLALVPSALLLGVTQHLATDVVSAPLLWVVPLALYLATFIAAFSTQELRELRDGGAPSRQRPRCSSWCSRWPRCATRSCRSRSCISRRSRCWRCCATRASPRAARIPRTSPGTSCASRSAACWAAPPRPSSRRWSSPRFSSTRSRSPPPSFSALRASRPTAWRHRPPRAGHGAPARRLLLVAGYWCVSAFNESANIGTARVERALHLAAVVHRGRGDDRARGSGIVRDPGGPAAVHAANGAALRRHGRGPARRRRA